MLRSFIAANRRQIPLFRPRPPHPRSGIPSAVLPIRMHPPSSTAPSSSSSLPTTAPLSTSHQLVRLRNQPSQRPHPDNFSPTPLRHLRKYTSTSPYAYSAGLTSRSSQSPPQDHTGSMQALMTLTPTDGYALRHLVSFINPPLCLTVAGSKLPAHFCGISINLWSRRKENGSLYIVGWFVSSPYFFCVFQNDFFEVHFEARTDRVLKYEGCISEGFGYKDYMTRRWKTLLQYHYMLLITEGVHQQAALRDSITHVKQVTEAYTSGIVRYFRRTKAPDATVWLIHLSLAHDGVEYFFRGGV